MAKMYDSFARKRLLKQIGMYYQYQLPTEEEELFLLYTAFREAKWETERILKQETMHQEDVTRFLNTLQSCEMLIRDYICSVLHFQVRKKGQGFDLWYQQKFSALEQNQEEWEGKKKILKHDMQYYLAKKTGTYETMRKFWDRKEE